MVSIRCQRAVWVTTVVLLLACVTEAGQQDWLQANRVKLRPGGLDGHTLITVELGEGGDVWIREEAKTDDTVTTVNVLLVGGKALAVTGGEVPSGAELELVDSAGLQLQLVEFLLARAYPKGPSSVKGHETISITEKTESIRIGTTGAKGYFSPPWSVAGEAKLLATDKVGFDFTFTFASDTPDKTPHTVKFAGIWHRDPHAPQFDDRLPLDGWTIYLLVTRSDHPESKYGAVATQHYRTLGELRQALHP